MQCITLDHDAAPQASFESLWEPIICSAGWDPKFAYTEWSPGKKPLWKSDNQEPYKTQLLVLWMNSRALAYSSLSALSQAQASSLPN